MKFENTVSICGREYIQGFKKKKLGRSVAKNKQVVNCLGVIRGIIFSSERP